MERGNTHSFEFIKKPKKIISRESSNWVRLNHIEFGSLSVCGELGLQALKLKCMVVRRWREMVGSQGQEEVKYQDMGFC